MIELALFVNRQAEVKVYLEPDDATSTTSHGEALQVADALASLVDGGRAPSATAGEPEPEPDPEEPDEPQSTVASATIRVVDDGGGALPFVIVTVTVNGASLQTAKSGADGEVLLADVDPSRIVAVVTGYPGHHDGIVAFDLEAGDSIDVDLVLRAIPASAELPPLTGVIVESSGFFVRQLPGSTEQILGKLHYTSYDVTVLEARVIETDWGPKDLVIPRGKIDDLWYRVRFAPDAFLRVIDEYDTVLQVEGDMANITAHAAALADHQGTEAWVGKDAMSVVAMPWDHFLELLHAFELTNVLDTLPMRLSRLRQIGENADVPGDDSVGCALVPNPINITDREPKPEKWSLLLESKQVVLADGEILDIHHFLLGVDGLIDDGRKGDDRTVYFWLDVLEWAPLRLGESYSALTWSGDVGAAVSDMVRHESPDWEEAAARRAPDKKLTPGDLRAFYFRTRCPDFDLLADIDAWGAYRWMPHRDGSAHDAAFPPVSSIYELVTKVYGPPGPWTPHNDESRREHRSRGVWELLTHYGFTEPAALRGQAQSVDLMERQLKIFAPTWWLVKEVKGMTVSEWGDFEVPTPPPGEFAEMVTGSGHLNMLFLDWMQQLAATVGLIDPDRTSTWTPAMSAATTSALASVARTLVDALYPLRDACRSPGAFVQLLRDLGHEGDADAAGLAGVDALATIADLVERGEQLVEQLDDDPGLAPIVAEVVLLGQDLLAAIDALRDVDGGALHPSLDDPDLWRDLAEALPGHLLVQHLEAELPLVYAALRVCGVIAEHPTASGGTREVVVAEQLGTVVSDPIAAIADRYGWGGTSGFEHAQFLDDLALILTTLGCEIRTGPAGEVVLPFVSGFGAGGFIDAGLALAPLAPGTGGQVDGVAITNTMVGSADVSPEIIDGWSVEVPVSLSSSGAVGLELTPLGAALQGELPGDRVTWALSGDPAEPWRLLGGLIETGGVDVELSIAGPVADAELVLAAGCRDTAITLSPSDGDSFLQDLVGADQLRIELSPRLEWSSRSGLAIEGTVGLDVVIPLTLRLGPLLVERLHLRLTGERRRGPIGGRRGRDGADRPDRRHRQRHRCGGRAGTGGRPARLARRIRPTAGVQATRRCGPRASTSASCRAAATSTSTPRPARTPACSTSRCSASGSARWRSSTPSCPTSTAGRCSSPCSSTCPRSSSGSGSRSPASAASPGSTGRSTSTPSGRRCAPVRSTRSCSPRTRSPTPRSSSRSSGRSSRRPTAATCSVRSSRSAGARPR